MNSSRLWTVGAVGAVVAIGTGAILLGVQPALTAAAAADASTSQTEHANSLSQTQLTGLAKTAAMQSTLTEQNKRLGRAATGSLRLNSFTQQLRTAAEIDGVSITVVSLGEAKDYVVPVADTSAAAATPAASPVATPSPSTSSAPDPAAVEAAATAAGLFAKTDPLITSENFTVIPASVMVTGSESAGVAFAQDVQQMYRLYAVDTITYSKGAAAGEPSSTTISGNIYALHR